MWGKNRAVFLFPFLLLFGCFDLAIKAMVNIGKYQWMRVTPATGWKSISYEFLKGTGTQTHGNCSHFGRFISKNSLPSTQQMASAKHPEPQRCPAPVWNDFCIDQSPSPLLARGAHPHLRCKSTWHGPAVPFQNGLISTQTWVEHVEPTRLT